MKPEKQIRLAYLIGQYPAVNHTFILREVLQLRAQGFDIHTASILKADRTPERLTPDERAELHLTTYIKPANPLHAIMPNLRTLLTRPKGYLRGLAEMLDMCVSAPKKIPTSVLYFVEAVALGRWMEERRLTHVHSHFTSSVCLLATRIFPFLTMSWTLHGPEEFNDAVGFRLAEKLRASAFVCAISNFARSQLMRQAESREWDKIEVSPLGVDPSVYRPRPFRAQPSPFEIICVGRLAPVKAQHILVEAVELLLRDGRDVRLRLVGDGPDRRALEETVARRSLKGRVVFEGWCNQDRVLELYKEADIFALASFAEGVPVVLMEAMAMEIPCVATRINGIPELIRDREDGLLVSPSDKEELKEAIARLMDDAELRRRLGEAGRRRVCERYDLARNTSRLADIFRRKLGAMVEHSAAMSSQRTATAQAAQTPHATDAIKSTASAES
ncbi:MAG TPA: glycosyltransferase family 4 protein [Pyrinomonadaceae bacterium]|jgi:glycosyltransferase involved in cell wall biosynthesis|nr:glycosyltransferase family 4 protein [Pyrinomonadaceae bacterium]